MNKHAGDCVHLFWRQIKRQFQLFGIFQSGLYLIRDQHLRVRAQTYVEKMRGGRTGSDKVLNCQKSSESKLTSICHDDSVKGTRGTAIVFFDYEHNLISYTSDLDHLLMNS